LNRIGGKTCERGGEEERGLEKILWTRQCPRQWSAMTLVKITSHFFILLFVGILPTLGICSKISLAFDDHRHATASSSTRDHQSDSNHEHSGNAEVHCPTVELFVPTSLFSVKSEYVLERILDSFVPVLVFHEADGEFYRLIHGPPVLPRSNGIPSHLFFSVLRI
jgi:hypothetical protein